MNLACVQTASLRWLGYVAMETVHGNKLITNYCRLVDLSTKYEVGSKDLQTAKFKNMPLLPWLQHFHTKKLSNLLSLPEGTCLPSMKFVPL